MGFSNQEVINISRSALLASVLDANSEAVWYEKVFPFEINLPSSRVWTETKEIPEANDLATARVNATNRGRIIKDYSRPSDSVRLTHVPGSNGSTYGAYSVYGDLSTDLLSNWIQPQRIQQSTGSNLGQPSFGYTVRLFNGDPLSGGKAISPTLGGTGSGQTKTVSWVFNYAMGILFLSNDFFETTGIDKATFNPYVLGFRYTGLTLEDARARSVVKKFKASESIEVGTVVRMSSGRDAGLDPNLVGGVLKASATNDSELSFEAVGISLESANAGEDIYVSISGEANVILEHLVTTMDIGRRLYLSSDNPGKVTIYPPAGMNDSVVIVGRLMSVEPNSYMQESTVDIDFVSHIG
jgi:hypothetical protein